MRATTYQDLALAGDLDASANLFLGRETLRSGLLGRIGWLDDKGMRRDAERHVKELGASSRPSSSVAPTRIIIDPTDAQAMVAPIEAAVEQGIPVMTTGNNVNTDVVFTRIAASSIEGGRAAAETMIELAPEGGPMLIVNVAPGISSTDDRDTGFREVMEGEDAFEVLDTQFSDDDQNEAANIVTSTLQANPELAGIFATNVINANGVASALRLAGRDDIPAIGYDASIEMAQALEEGLLDAIISQDPAGIGRLAVEDTIAHLNGEEVPADQPLEPLVITQETLDTPEGQAGIYSEQS